MQQYRMELEVATEPALNVVVRHDMLQCLANECDDAVIVLGLHDCMET